MHSLDDLQLFALTVRYQGISAAAKACHLQRSKVSRRLQELERQLGYQLLIRTTRHIELTEQGEWLYQQVGSHLNTLDEAMSMLAEQNREPMGKLRMAIPPVLGVTEFFTSVIERYTSLYPKVKLEIEHQKQAIDLRRTNTDIQVLPVYSPPINDDYVQQYFIELPCVMVASPDYLAKMGEPKSVDELTQHLLLGNRYSKMQLPRNTDYYVYSEDLHLLRNMARDGKGISMLPAVMVNPGIKEGIFIPLLHDHKFAGLKVTLIYASKPFQSQKCRNMVQLLRQTATEEGVISYPK
jgi:DNA-binding transcriptional LysR family regulator